MSPNSISVLTRNYCEKQDEKNRGKFFLTFSDTEETRDLLLLNFFSSKVPISLVPSSGSVAPHSKANNWGASVCSKERCFIQKSWQSGEKADLCPETNSKDFDQLWQFFEGKSETFLVGGQLLYHFSILCSFQGRSLEHKTENTFALCIIYIIQF